MRPRKGFTMIELMVVIAILGIGAAMSVSSLITVLPKWKLQGSATDILTQVQYARFEAVRRSLPVIVTFANKGNTSTSSVSISVDANRNSVADAGEPVLRTVVIPSVYPKVYISTVTDGLGAVTSFVIGPDGMIRGLTMPITITMASQIATVATNYQVVVARSGIAKTAP